MKAGCQASIDVDAKKESCLNSFRDGRKYSMFFFFFQFYWKPMRSPVTNDVKNVAKMFVLLLNKQLRLRRKMLMNLGRSKRILWSRIPVTEVKALLLSIIIINQGMDQVEFNSKETGSLYA